MFASAQSSHTCHPARAHIACKMAMRLPASSIKLGSLRVARSVALIRPARLSRCYSGEGEVNRQAVEGEKTATGAQKVSAFVLFGRPPRFSAVFWVFKVTIPANQMHSCMFSCYAGSTASLCDVAIV